jgi:hemerythrin-like domain-containing protein
LFAEIQEALELHTALEEEIFYREAEREGEKRLQDLLREAREEHGKVKELLRDADGRDPSSGEFDAAVAAIKGAVEHHVEEEEVEMFPRVRTTFSRKELQELGGRMEARRKELVKSRRADEAKPGLLDKLASLVGVKEA